MKALSFLSNIKVFLITSVLFIFVGLTFLLTGDKTAIHIAINNIHNAGLDVFFTYCTHLGDGAVTAISIIPLGLILYRKYSYSTFVLGATSLLFCGIIAQFLKRVVYPNAERPIKFIGEDLLYLVPDVEVHSMNSFPSGHTATAFAFFAFITFAFFRKKPMLQLLMAFIAVLIGYSRMYLSQHFLEDVVLGACVGIVAFLLAQLVTYAIPMKKNISRS